MIVIAAFLGLFILLYMVAYMMVYEGKIYQDIYDSANFVKVVKKNLFKTTIAYLNQEPETMLTISFMIRYTLYE